MGRREQEEYAVTFVQGLLSDLSHKNAESIAYRFGQEWLPLQILCVPSQNKNRGGDIGVERCSTPSGWPALVCRVMWLVCPFR